LLDASLDHPTDGANGSEDSDQSAALLLLRQAAELTLEGRLRPAEEPPAPIRAPMPKHAAPLLNRLLLVERPAFGTVAQFRDELAASRDQPPEVNSAQRAAHLALLSAVLFFPLLFMFVLPFLYPAILRAGGILFFNSHIREEQQILSNLQDGMRRDFLFSIPNPDPFISAYGVVRLQTDTRLSQRLIQRVQRDVAQENRLRASAGWMAQALLNLLVTPEGWSRIEKSEDFRKVAEDVCQAAEPTSEVTELWPVGLIFVLPFPLIWLLWAFLLRGGYTLRLAGIALLRSNGRKALRIQCAWRALLVWMPIVALLTAMAWLDGRWLAVWFRQSTYGWPYWLSSVCWALAVLLLPVYIGLALWLPNRCLHDRLAGTYLVPR
jgi:hypothetical protein